VFGSEILDVAIGLIFIYLTLSLAVTAANEMLAAWFKRRAWMLRKGIINLLDTTADVDKLFNHPLIRGLSQPRGRWSNVPVLGWLFAEGPSYIPSRTFAIALLDQMFPVTNGQRTVPAPVPSMTPLQYTLSVLYQEAKGNDEQFKANVEVWFNDSMERVSGWYKRRTHFISLVCAAVVTVGTNADTIVIARALWNDPALRQAVVARAEQYVQKESNREITPVTDDAPPPPPLPPDQQAEVDFADAEAALSASMEDLEALNLPIGWNVPGATQDATGLAAIRLVKDSADAWPGAIWPPWDRAAWARWLAALDRHMLGWILTILAVSLGAPFWFDMLNRVVAIRSAGKAPEEAPKKPKEVPQPREPGATPGAAPSAAPVPN
jgi:hypothetical protein